MSKSKTLGPHALQRPPPLRGVKGSQLVPNGLNLVTRFVSAGIHTGAYAPHL